MVKKNNKSNKTTTDSDSTNILINPDQDDKSTEYKETKEIKKRQIRIADVALVAKEVLGVDIKIDM